MQDGTSNIRDLSRLARQVSVWTVAWAVAQVGLSFFSYLELQELRNWDGDRSLEWLTPVLDPSIDLYAAIVGVLAVIVWLVSGVLALRWIFLSNRNAQRLSGGLNISPGWNVGWFFVPFATWFKPFQGMDETWRASKQPDNWRVLECAPLLRWWWGFWLATSILGTISFRLQIREHSVGQAIVADSFDILSTALAVPAAYFFIKLVNQLTIMQSRFARG